MTDAISTPITYRVLYDEQASEAYKIFHAYILKSNNADTSKTHRSLAVFCHDEHHKMMAGACGIVYPGWLSLDLVWVEPPYRQAGTGAAILKKIEQEAVTMGAHSAYVWTQDYEAPGFYAKYGYQEFVQLQEFLPGHQLIGMQKKLINS